MSTEQWYQFRRLIDCNSTERWEPLREPAFLAFLFAADVSQCLLCLLSLLLNSLAYIALGRDGSDCALALQLRSIAVADAIYVVANTIDNFCHTLETLPAPTGDTRLFLLPMYGHPFVWGIRVTFITVHNWLMLFMAAVRFAKIRWPLRANLWFSRRRTLHCIGAIWLVAMATSLVRGLEVTSVLADCTDGFSRMAIVASLIFPAYTFSVNFGLQTVTPVVAVMVVNALLLRAVRRSNSFQRGAAGGCSSGSPTSTTAVSAVSIVSVGGGGGGSSGNVSEVDSKKVQKQEKQFRQLTRMVMLLMYMYLVCQTPMLLYGFVVSFKIPTNLYIILTLVGNVISSMDGTCNFFVYVVTNPKFKREVRSILGLAARGVSSGAQSGLSLEAAGARPPPQQNRV